MDDNAIKSSAIHGMFWASIDRVAYIAIQFVVNIILANILMPEDFGAIGVLMIFIAVAQTLADGGFASSLIQKKLPTKEDYGTVFICNIVIAALIYLILFLSAPFIARFYHNDSLTTILRLMSISFVINALFNIQLVKLRKEMRFKTIAISNLSSYLICSCLAIWMAYVGYGVWSLVCLQVSAALFLCLFYWTLSDWRPVIVFSKQAFRGLFSYGGYLLCGDLLQTFCRNFQSLIIGRRFNEIQMGYFALAYKVDNVTSYSLPQALVQVIFPLYSAIQDESMRLKRVLSTNIRIVAFLIFPCLTLLIYTAEDIFPALLGNKWDNAVPYFRILCVGGFFVCLQNINYYAVAAKGFSRVLFLWSLYKWGFLILIMIMGSHYGMYGVVWSLTISNANIYLTNALLAHKYVGYDVTEQLRQLFPIVAVLLISIVTANVVAHMGADISISSLALVSSYVLFSIIFRLRVINDLANVAKLFNLNKI